MHDSLDTDGTINESYHTNYFLDKFQWKGLRYPSLHQARNMQKIRKNSLRLQRPAAAFTAPAAFGLAGRLLHREYYPA
jgi:hypothetical protein